MYLIEVHYEVHSEVNFQFLLHSGIYPYLNIVYVTKFQENAPVSVFLFMDIEFDSITIEELSNNTQASVRHPEDCGFDSHRDIHLHLNQYTLRSSMVKFRLSTSKAHIIIFPFLTSFDLQ